MATTAPRLTAARLAALTPADRDRYLDLLRVASIGVVVVGHWLMAAVTWGPAGVEARNLLEVVPAVRPVTWLLQVMPVFFLVGGFANARGWVSTVAGGRGYADFLARRADRLLRPVAPLLVLWFAVALAVAPTRAGSEAVRMALLVAVQPLWFVAIYLLVVALTPPMLWLHERYGAAVPAALAALVVVVDVVRLAGGVAAAGYLNYAAVWLLAHQLGFFYRDGRLQTIPRPALLGIAAAAAAALIALTTVGPYPVSMVGLPGDRISNIAPPTAPVAVLTVLLCALVLLARPAASRWVRRPGVWRVVVGANTVVMTVFVWQLTVLVAAVAVASSLRLPSPAPASAGWWLTRPVWLIALAGVLAAVVRLTARWERTPAPPARQPSPGTASAVVAAIGAAYVVLGLAGLALCGLAGPLGTHAKPLLQLTVGPLLSLTQLALGAWLVRAAGAVGPQRGLRAAAVGFAVLAVLGAFDFAPLGHGISNAATHAATAAALAGMVWRGRRAPRVEGAAAG